MTVEAEGGAGQPGDGMGEHRAPRKQPRKPPEMWRKSYPPLLGYSPHIQSVWVPLVNMCDLVLRLYTL